MAVMLSGIQPSHHLHLGNYLGALRRWIGMQAEYECYFLLVDLHTITLPQNPEELRQNSYRGLATYLAAGLDPEKSALFMQSHCPEHAELAWVLTCFTYMGELQRMTQFKEKGQTQGRNIPVGLFSYPVLMAADILLYQADFVPVGDDQQQHLELARDLAQRLNNRFDQELFRVPKPLIGSAGARIMDLQEPTKKMSKSAANHKGVLFFGDTDKQLTKKLKSAQTDSASAVAEYENCSPGVRNLLHILAVLQNETVEIVAAEFLGKTYGELKVAAADRVVAAIAPIRTEAERLLQDIAYLDKVLQEGASRARERARHTLSAVYKAIGFI